MRNNLRDLLFILQLEEYDTKRFLTWTREHQLSEIKEDKKQLKWTAKARIIYFLAKLLTLVGLNPVVTLTLVTKLLFLPELIAKNTIVTLARIKLKFYPKLVVIGITGSYGKTSVKEILYQVLKTKYQILKTPENINTPLGIARVILKDLKKNHDIFIVEMGAYQKGDIEGLCNFVKPSIGILTAIGKQHLERFGSLENIITAKSELIEALPKNGLAVLNGDNPYCFEIAKKLQSKTILYSLTNKITKPMTNNQRLTTITAVNIAVSNTGSSFQIKNGGEVLELKTSLLGAHNVLNILPAVAIACELGISGEKIAGAISNLTPLLHRLQPIVGANGTLIIDDSYNANPSSVKAALAVLKEIHSPRKIVITPGLVELGREQEKENEIFGEEIAKVTDYLIIVGWTNKLALKKGFISNISKNYDTVEYHSRVIECLNLQDATKKLQEIVISKSVILFENDLPDQYT